MFFEVFTDLVDYVHGSCRILLHSKWLEKVKQTAGPVFRFVVIFQRIKVDSFLSISHNLTLDYIKKVVCYQHKIVFQRY